MDTAKLADLDRLVFVPMSRISVLLLFSLRKSDENWGFISRRRSVREDGLRIGGNMEQKQPEKLIKRIFEGTVTYVNSTVSVDM